MTHIANNRDQTIAEKVIERFGGMTAMTKVTPYEFSKVRNFKRSGNIPECERATILRCAKEAGVDVTPWTFIEHLITLA